MANPPVDRALEISRIYQDNPDLPRPWETEWTPPSYDEYMRYGNLRNMMNFGLQDVYPRSGGAYSPVGARAGYEDHGFPPPVHLSNPITTITGRAFTDPYGNLGWQPLQGFPSAYPHVLNGVPVDPIAGTMSLMQRVLPSPVWPYFPMPPMMSRGAAPVRGGGNGGPPAGNGTPPAGNTRTTQPAVPGGPYDETKWRNETMPKQRPVAAPAQGVPTPFSPFTREDYTLPKIVDIPALLQGETPTPFAREDYSVAPPAQEIPATPESAVRRAQAAQALFPQGMPTITAPSGLPQAPLPPQLPPAQLPITPMPQQINPLINPQLRMPQAGPNRSAQEYGGYIS